MTDQHRPSAHQPSSDAELESLFSKFKDRTAWRVLVRNEARSLLGRIQETECARDLDSCNQDEARRVRESIGRALEAVSYQPLRGARFSDWASGSGIETAWSELHGAGQRLLMIQSPEDVRARLAEIDAALRANLKEDDSRLAPASKRLVALGDGPLSDIELARSEIRQYLQTADSASDAAHANVRSFRNLLVLIGSIVAAAAIGLSVLHALVPGFLDLSGPAPAKGVMRPDAIEPWQAVLAGATGGLMAALFSIWRLGGFSGAYRLPAYQALIRIPAGALVGLVAAILLQAQFIDVLKPQFGLSLLAYALVFGYAPEVLLRYVDQRAQKVLGQAQTKNDPGRPALAKPAQG